MLPNQRSLSGFSREQKIGFIFMLIFAILTVGLGGLQLRNTIYGRFVVKKADTNPFASLTNNDEERLKNIDTDRDGLTDFEELQQYETSPYLPDSDSDGVMDKIEIEKVTDPLCPNDMVCAGADSAGVTATSSLSSPLLNQTATPSDILNFSGQASAADPNATAELEALINNPEQLRNVILSTGKIDPEVLSKIDDKTLQEMAQKLLNNPESALSATTTSTVTTTIR